MTCFKKTDTLPAGWAWVPGMPTFSTEADCGNECPDCVGPCCHADGSCTEETKADCDTSGGKWLGVGADCADCPQPPPAVDTTGCCSGGVVTACYDGGVEVPCPDCGTAEWGYKVGEIMFSCWEELDTQWCQDQVAANPTEWKYLDDYCNTAFYSDYHALAFPVADCPATAALYGPDPYSSCVTTRRTVQTATGKITVATTPLPPEAVARLKRDNPLP
jgi:hypothetical protein